MEYDLFHEWEPIIERYKNRDNIEIEFRFGRRNGTKFDTNVGKATFEKCLTALQSYKGWENTSHNKYSVYYFDGGKRMQINEETEDRDSQIKQRIEVSDFQHQSLPFDVRIGVSQETPFEYNGETATDQKTKERWSFVRKNLSIDVSKIEGDPDDPDCDEDTTFQIEMEIIKPALLHTRDETFNLVYKVFDLMKCVN
jgi:hypothetical protein